MSSSVSNPNSNVVVMKFGGTSVGDVGRIKRVAEIVVAHKKKHPATGIAVVVSAMAGETNKLVALAKGCVPVPDPREYDVLLASGEQVTISLLAMTLIAYGIPAKSLLAAQAQIQTDHRYNNAKIVGIEASEVDAVLAAGGVPVVAGFQGVTAHGDLTTLGRGGSDITAVALAAVLNARCYIYTDVPGVFTTDPRVVPKARLLKQICHNDMLEMASLGAKVLHTRSVYFANRFNVPLVILSTFHGDYQPGINGTEIVRSEEIMETPVITGIAYRLDEARITVEGLPAHATSLADLFDGLGRGDVPIDMISQGPSQDERITVSFTVPDESSTQALQIARELVPSLKALGASIGRDVAKISVVGIGMRYHTGVAGRLFRALAKQGVLIDLVSASETKISLLVPRKYCEVAVRAIHQEFIELNDAAS